MYLTVAVGQRFCQYIRCHFFRWVVMQGYGPVIFQMFYIMIFYTNVFYRRLVFLLLVNFMQEMLSLLITIGNICSRSNSWHSARSHCTSYVALDAVMYSAVVDDKATQFLLLRAHESTLIPDLNKFLIVDFLPDLISIC